MKLKNLSGKTSRLLFLILKEHSWLLNILVVLKIYHNLSEFNVNSNFKGHFEVGKEETAVISTMELLSDIGSSVETMSGDGFFDAILLEKNIIFS